MFYLSLTLQDGQDRRDQPSSMLQKLRLKSIEPRLEFKSSATGWVILHHNKYIFLYLHPMIYCYSVLLQKKKKDHRHPIIIVTTIITFLCLGICHVQNISGAPRRMVIKGSMEMSTLSPRGWESRKAAFNSDPHKEGSLPGGRSSTLLS